MNRWTVARWMLPPLAAAAAAWLAVPGLAAAAPEVEVEVDGAEDEEHRHEADRNLLGIKVGSVLVVEPEGGPDGGPHSFPAWTAALFYERSLVHNWLELELATPVGVGMTADETHVFLPLNFHLKKPFHPTPSLSPYVGVGPMMDLYLAPEVRVAFGGSLSVGTFIWPPRSPIGIDLDVEYDLVAVEGKAAHEVMLAMGPIWRF